MLMTHSQNRISTLIKSTDGDEYKLANFSEDRLSKFRVFFVTIQRFPDPAMVNALYPIEVVPASAAM